MTESLVEIRERLRRRYPSLSTPVPTEPEPVVEDSIEEMIVLPTTRGTALVTAPAETMERATASFNEGFTYIRGRFAGGGVVNRNGHLWSPEDLQGAERTVAHGPLNWLHNERHIVGALTGATFVQRAQADADPPHLVADAAVWRFLYPEEARSIERAERERALWYSMECVAESVTCTPADGHDGCGETFGFREVMMEPKRVCAHLQSSYANGGSVRQMHKPVFLGGAVIVPPVQPAWADASAEVRREAASVIEEAGLEAPEAREMVATLLRYAQQPG